MKKGLLVLGLLFIPAFIAPSCAKNEESIITHNVTFNAGSGYFTSTSKKMSNILKIEVENGNTVDRPLDPMIYETGLEFDNWYKDDGLTQKFDFATVIDKDITLYARYTYEGEEPFYFEIRDYDVDTYGTVNIGFDTYEPDLCMIDFDNIWYCIDTTIDVRYYHEWIQYQKGETIEVPKEKRLYIKANQRSWQYLKLICEYSSTSDVPNYNVGGNIMSLLDSNNYRTRKDFQGQQHVFDGFFYADDTHHNGDGLKDASSLRLPAVFLSISCYRDMFYGCSGLTASPHPIANGEAATYSEFSCYQMFYGCNNVALQENFINAKKVESYAFYKAFDYCYAIKSIEGMVLGSINGEIGERACERMFHECRGLVKIENLQNLLPAEILSKYCYSEMFSGCINLEELTGFLPGSKLADYCYYSMFGYSSDIMGSNPPASNKLTKIEDIDYFLPARSLALSCYDSMFSSSRSLKYVTGSLPATTLAASCYEKMFAFCDELLQAPTLPYKFEREVGVTPEWKEWEFCYNRIFYRCFKLSEVEVGFSYFRYDERTDGTSSHDYIYTQAWLEGIEIPGTLKWRGTESEDPMYFPVRTSSTLPENWKPVRIQ